MMRSLAGVVLLGWALSFVVVGLLLGREVWRGRQIRKRLDRMFARELGARAAALVHSRAERRRAESQVAEGFGAWSPRERPVDVGDCPDWLLDLWDDAKPGAS